MRSEIQSMHAIRGADVPLPLRSAFCAEFLQHSVGQELFTRLREFISTTWNIDTNTSTSCVNEAVAVIEAEMQRRTAIHTGIAANRGGLGICRIRTVVRFIETNLNQRISIGRLASLVKLSSSQFQRAFKQSFGEATHMYLIKRRVDRAKTMMLSSDTSFSEIALACGFSDQSHMTRLFTRLVGQSPKTWQRNRI